MYMSNICEYLTLLQIYFFQYKAADKAHSPKIRTVFVWIPETKEIGYYYVTCFASQNGNTNQIILDNTMKPRKTSIIVLIPGVK